MLFTATNLTSAMYLSYLLRLLLSWSISESCPIKGETEKSCLSLKLEMFSQNSLFKLNFLSVKWNLSPNLSAFYIKYIKFLLNWQTSEREYLSFSNSPPYFDPPLFFFAEVEKHRQQTATPPAAQPWSGSACTPPAQPNKGRDESHRCCKQQRG